MNQELYEEQTDEDWLSRDEMDEMRRERLGAGMDEVEEEWMNLVRFSYQMEVCDVVEWVEELGATTTIAIVVVSAEDVDEPDKEDQELLESMMKQDNQVAGIATVVDEDESLSLAAAGWHPRKDDYVSIEVWT